MNEEQFEKMQNGVGFIAALDQSGGSTPKALEAYGVSQDRWSSEDEMYLAVHEMRTRIITSSAFGGDRVLGAILFENTMDRLVEGRPTADFLWSQKKIIPILKVDKGLADAQHGAQLMKPNPDLPDLLRRAVDNGIFGTKMRSVIMSADATGVKANIAQQFDVGLEIIANGLIPILEPEVDIHAPDKAEAETMVHDEIMTRLATLDSDQRLMFKLTLPNVDDLYADVIDHPNVVRVVALSGGYSLEEACDRLARNHRMIASFSRALSGGLTAQQSDEEFDAKLDSSIQAIYDASKT